MECRTRLGFRLPEFYTTAHTLFIHRKSPGAFLKEFRAGQGDILVVGPSWVGDMVMAQSLFKCLNNQFPSAAIDVLAPVWSSPLLERMTEVRSTINLPFRHGELRLGERMALGRSLASQGYARAIVLPNSFKSALIPFFAEIPVRTGWRGEMRFVLLNDIRLLRKERYPRMIDRFAALAFPADTELPEPLPWPSLSVAGEARQSVIQRFDLNLTRPVVALCPGAEFGTSKRWPAENFAKVACEMIDSGRQVWIMGSARDRQVAEKVLDCLADATARYCHCLAGATTLAEAIDLLSAADAVVSNDSGLMHISAALGIPLLVIYGSTSPDFTPPLADKVAIESVPVDCGPCFKRDCPQGHLKCQWGVTPESVIASLRCLLVKRT